MGDSLVIILGFVAAVAAAIATVLATRRVASGKVDTTEASVLWEESSKLRADLRTEVVELRAEVVEVRARVDELRTLNEQLRIENSELRVELEMERARHA